jgi:hypothetical protein
MSTTRLFLELVNLFSPLKYLQIEKKKKTMSPFAMVIFVKTSYGKYQSMLAYRIVRIGNNNLERCNNPEFAPQRLPVRVS